MDFPKSTPGVGLVDGRFVDENVVTGQPGSLIPAVWGNSVTNELLGVIRAGGYVPDEQNSAQLLSAIGELNNKAIRDRIATQDEVNEGSETGKLVTPKALSVKLGNLWQGATEAAFGVVKLASQVEVNEGWDEGKAVTPKTLSVKLGNLWQGATEAAFGVVKIASQAEVNEGWDTEKAVTSKTLSVKLGNLWQGATEAAFGVMKIASQGETNSGVEDGKAVTPRKLRAGISASFGSRGHFAFPTWLGGWIINWGLESGIPQATDSVSSVGPTKDVTLSLAYPNQGFGALASMSFSTMGVRAAYTPGAVLLSKSTLRLQNNYTGSAGDIFWISIGN